MGGEEGWQELRGNKLGVHFRRQQIIAGFIADFYFHTAGLVIELDGNYHERGEQPELDRKREQVFIDMGLKIVRIRNDEVMKDFPVVLQRIRDLLSGHT